MKIRILGGGIAGLTAAITLQNAGCDVEVHEKKRFCGKHTADHQYLENWIFDADPLDYLRSIGIAIGFYCKPIYTQSFLSPSGARYTGKSKTPLMYLAKRGAGDDSIDQSLQKQAEAAGARFFYESKLDRSGADIIASGSENPNAAATGIRFRLDLPDQSFVILANDLSQSFYSYLIVNDGEAEIVCCNSLNVKDISNRLKETVERFEELLSIRAQPVTERFACVGEIRMPSTAKIGKQLYVGEAAGFQDQFAGFGMGYAFRSGYLAARSIVQDQDYDRLWKHEFLRPLRISQWNRRFFARLSDENYERVIDLLSSRNPVVRWLRGGDDLREMMRRLYRNPIPAILYSVSDFRGILKTRRTVSRNWISVESPQRMGIGLDDK